MDRRRSPAEVETRAEMTSSLTCTFSESAIWVSLAEVELVSRGLNLNLEQRDAKGSMILANTCQLEVLKQWGLNGPRNVIAHETEAGNSRICLHDTAQGTLGILSHRISLVEDNYFVGWTRVGFSVRRNSLRAGCLPSKVLDFLPNDADPALVGCV
jgi:hypothetical protein